MEEKQRGQTCGLCGNFDSDETNEFLSDDGTYVGVPRGCPPAGPSMLTRPVSTGKLLEPHQFAALQKLDDPNEVCVAELGPWPRGPRTAEHVSHGGIGSGPKAWCLAGFRGAVVGGRRPVKGSGPLPAPSFHSRPGPNLYQAPEPGGPPLRAAPGPLSEELPGGPGGLRPPWPAQLQLSDTVRVLPPVQCGRRARQPVAQPRPLR